VAPSMRWASLPVTLPSAIAIIVLSFFVTLVVKVPQRLRTEIATSHDTISTDQKQVVPDNEGPDTLSFIQGRSIKVDLQSQSTETSGSSSSESAHASAKSNAKAVSDGEKSVPVLPVHSASARSSSPSSITMLLQEQFGNAATFLQLRTHRVVAQSVLSSPIVLMMLLSLLAAAVIACFSYSGGAARDDYRRSNVTGTGKKESPSQYLSGHRAPSRDSNIRLSPRNNALVGLPSQSQADTSTFGLRPWSPLPQTSSPYPSMAQVVTQSSNSLLVPQSVQAVPMLETATPQAGLPPPLCPNVVLPNCEVRVGVPMHELGKVSSEGELTIVGLSGNPLLRAVLQNTEAGRTLEISMPEPRSAARAVVGPCVQDARGQKSRAVRICGMKGAFYGMLEMRSSGACYVTKEGQTVLIIDGDSEHLHLMIKSGHGDHLAAVTCSSEPFGGSEHLEIRVQPGVDTVLVLACVLSVVLLSPYPPSDHSV